MIKINLGHKAGALASAFLKFQHSVRLKQKFKFATSLYNLAIKEISQNNNTVILKPGDKTEWESLRLNSQHWKEMVS